MNKFTVKVVVLLIALIGISSAQIYPDTLWVPVVFRDFHSDGSCPEFEMSHHGGVRTGLIEDTLDSDLKPISTHTYLNWYIKYWYRDWADSAQGDYTKPIYDGDGNFVSIQNISHDTAFKNITVYDTLPFIHTGNGVYDFIDDEFFPLDGKGFEAINPGHEVGNHNFAFTMELVTSFVMKEGLTFNFRGDDDVWAFIDHRLMMDLGNLHSAANGSFNTDTISGLTIGQEYDFHLFFAERHSTGSHIRITTNLVSTHIVAKVTIEAVPDTAIISAGDSVLYVGKVWYDSTGADGIVHELVDTNFSNNITWSLISNNSTSDPSKSSLLPAIGDSSTFTTTEAYETFTVVAAYEDPVSHQITSDTMQIQVIPDIPDHIVAEASPDTSSMSKKQNDTPMDTLTILAANTSGSAYGIIRDKYGNFINYTQNTTWTLLSNSVLQSANVGNIALGEGIITKSGFSGSDQVSVKDNDHAGLSYLDTFMVVVKNDKPIANNDNYSSQEDMILTVPSVGKPNVLANDVDNLSLKAYLVSSVDPTKGTLNWNSSNDGSFTFVPVTNFNGTVTFTYKASDGEFESNIATVIINVGADNDAPVANDTIYSTPEDTKLTVSTPGILNNDKDVDGDALTATLIQDVTSGTLSLSSNGSFEYTPATNFNGTVSFKYQAVDSKGANSNVATVTIDVTPVNDAPISVADNYTAVEDNTLTVTAGNGVLSNDSDMENNTLTATLVDNVSHGTLTLNANGSFEYTPSANYYGTDSFTYKASDGSLTSAKITVSITVSPVNDAPVSFSDNYTVAEDNTLTVNSASGVLSNDTDIEGNSLTAVLVTNVSPTKGTLTLNSDGSFSFVPVANFNGAVFFSYQANDGNSNSAPVNVLIDVTPVNDKPIANNDGYSVEISTKLTVELPGVMGNDNDVDQDILSTELVAGTAPANGTLLLNSDGSFEYTPLNGDVAIYTFKYKLSDGSLSDTATVTLDVGSNNTEPVSTNDSYTVAEDSVLNISMINGVLKNDTDANSGTTLTASLVASVDVSKGSLVFNADGSFTFTPVANYNGIVTFTYQANDGYLSSNISTVTITVTPVDDAPIAVADTYTVFEDKILTVPSSGNPSLIANDEDIDNAKLTVALSQAVSSGTLSLGSGGSFVYTPPANFNGTATFKYKAFDSELYSNEATVLITVVSVNDTPIISGITGQTISKGDTFTDINLNDFVTDNDNNVTDLNWNITGNTNLTITIDSLTHVMHIVPNDKYWDGSETITLTVTDSNGANSSVDLTFEILKQSRLPLPEVTKNVGTYTDSILKVNLYTPGFSTSEVPYTSTEDNTTPLSPLTNAKDTTDSAKVLTFGPYLTDSTYVRISGYSLLYPYENSEVRTFEYLLVFPQLPDPVVDKTPGDYDTTNLTVAISVPNQPNAKIYYTLDGTDPKTSSTKVAYTGSINFGPYTSITTENLKVYAIEDYFKPSTAEFTYNFNPQALPKPVADPAGCRFHTDSLLVKLYVPNNPDAEIHFTTDGSIPTSTSPLYSSKIVVKDNTTIKAVAIKDGLLPGPVMTEYYVKSIPTKILFFASDTSTVPLKGTELIQAGKDYNLVAKVFDQYDTLLTEFMVTDAPIYWTLTEQTGSNTAQLTNDKGYNNTVIGIKAYNTILVSALFQQFGYTVEGNITLIINPGAANKIWIEPDYDRLTSPNDPNPIDTVKLSSNFQKISLYAVLRDSLGNYISTSQYGIWSPSLNDTATAVKGNSAIGEGIILKGRKSGTIISTVTDTTQNLSKEKDSVVVFVLQYWYDSLRIVTGNNSENEVDTVIINTNQDTAIQVFGHRDDGLSPEWEAVNATWEILDNKLDYIIDNPGNSHEYELSPVDTARGKIRVTLGNDTITFPDTVFVQFTPGGATKAKFKLLSPDDSLIAGERLRTIVELFNQDNKPVYIKQSFPGDGDSAMYIDKIGNGGKKMPTFTIDSTEYILYDAGTNCSQIFETYSDSVGFILYNAPVVKDSVHKLTVFLDNTISASTREFRLLPAKLGSIEITSNGIKVDTIVTTANKGVLFIATGKDIYGNVIETVTGNWKSAGDIPDITFSQNTQQIYYKADTVTYETQGFIIVTDVNDTTIKDTVVIKIKPEPAKLTGALTKDLNGNGYLDAIQLTFDKKVYLPDSALSSDLITLSLFGHTNSNVVIDSIVAIGTSTDETDSAYMVYFSEIETDSMQTGWLPNISIFGIEDIETITLDTCEDGAPPVIWKAIKTKNNNSVSKDKIEITLSEPIYNTDKSEFNYNNIKPSDIFNVWVQTNSGLAIVDTMLNGIQYFTSKNGNTITFLTSNGNNIGDNHYFTLKEQDSLLVDINGNTPDSLNHPVKVKIIGFSNSISVGPNPITVTTDFFSTNKNEPLTAIDMYEAIEKVNSHGGTVIAVNLEMNLDKETAKNLKITGQLMIFDISGNLVYMKKNDDNLLPASWDIPDSSSFETRQLVFYWDGMTGRGKPASPGVYKTVIFVRVGDNNIKLEKIIAVAK